MTSPNPNQSSRSTQGNTAPSGDFIPPHNIAAEEAILGSILLQGSIPATLTDFDAGDFYAERNRRVYQAFQSLAERGIAIDQVSTAVELEEHGLLEQVGGAGYMGQLVVVTPTSLHAQYYAAQVSRLAARRRILRVLQDSVFRALDADTEPHDAAESISDLILNAAQVPEHYKTRFTWTELLNRVMEQSAKPAGERLPTGFKPIDYSLGGGIERGSLAILAADTGMGKTTLAMQWALDWARLGKRIGVMSFEMVGEALATRAMASEANVPTLRLEDSLRNETADSDRVMDAVSAQYELDIVVDTRMRDIEGIVGWIRREHRQGGLDCVVVDHLQLLPTSDTQHRVAQMDALAISLKRVALELNMVVLAISQPNRAGLSSNNGRLTVSALRDSHGIGANADVVMALHKPDLKDKDETRSKVVLHFAKNRFGPDGSEMAMQFDNAFSRFKPWTSRPKT